MTVNQGFTVSCIMILGIGIIIGYVIGAST